MLRLKSSFQPLASEFWILLHFTKIVPNLSANQSPCKALQKHKDFKKHLPHYSKDYDFEGVIAERLSTAVKNAKAVNKANLSIRQSPYTEVVRLMENLQNLVENDKIFTNQKFKHQ